MSLLQRRSRPAKSPARHTPAGVRAAASAAELAQPAGRHAAQDEPAAPDAGYGTGYDHPGWDDQDAERALLMPASGPGAPPAAGPPPAGDETMLFRVPGIDGRAGFIIPPGDFRAADPEDALPHRSPGEIIPPAAVPVLRTEPADPGLLRDLRDALKALPGSPQRDSGETAPPAAGRRKPVAWLRVIEHDGHEAHEALTGSPEFAGSDTLPDGTVIAGMFLGIHGKATWLADSVDPAWCDDAVTALTAMRDHLTAARGQQPQGDADEPAGTPA